RQGRVARRTSDSWRTTASTVPPNLRRSRARRRRHAFKSRLRPRIRSIRPPWLTRGSSKVAFWAGSPCGLRRKEEASEVGQGAHVTRTYRWSSRYAEERSPSLKRRNWTFQRHV